MSIPNSGNHLPPVLPPTQTDPHNDPVSGSSVNSGSPTKPASAMPTMYVPTSNRNAELFQFLAEFMDTGLPDEFAHLLETATEITLRPKPQKAGPVFELVANKTSVRSLVTRLNTASQQGLIPNPYPINRDPLDLEVWANKASWQEVTFVAKRFPELDRALKTYRNKSGID